MKIEIEDEEVEKCGHCKVEGHSSNICVAAHGRWVCSRKTSCSCAMYLNKKITVGDFFLGRPSKNFKYEIIKNPNYSPCTILEDARAVGIDLMKEIKNYKLSDKSLSVEIDGESIEYSYLKPEPKSTNLVRKKRRGKKTKTIF